MTQMKVGSFTSTGAVKTLSFGFTVDQITLYNSTAPGIFAWNSSMASGSYWDVAAGTYTSSNGFTPLAQGVLVGPPITAISTGATTSVTASNLDQFSIVAGYVVNLVEIADDLTGTTLNLTSATVASVSSTAVVLSVNTSSGYSAYVSGGYIVPVTDANGDPVATQNVAIRGLSLGSGVYGTTSDAITYVAFGQNSVV